MTTQKWTSTGGLEITLGASAQITFGTMALIAKFTDYDVTTDYLRMMTLSNATYDDVWSIDHTHNAGVWRVTSRHRQADLVERFRTYNVTFPDLTWVLIVVTKATGTSTPRMHWWRADTQAWTHADFNSSAADTVTPTLLRIGGAFGQLGGAAWQPNWLAACGLFNAALSDANCETLTQGLHKWMERADNVGCWATVGLGADVVDLKRISTYSSDAGGSTLDTAEDCPIPLVAPVMLHQYRNLGAA